MKSIDLILKNLEFKNCSKQYGILLASIMFIWSGINKILNFDKKSTTLCKKLPINCTLSKISMILVILLEIVGFLFLIEYFFKKSYMYDIFNKTINFAKVSQRQLIQVILLLLLLFLVVVTLIYHPFNLKHPIPFLSNLTTFGLFLYVYSDLFKC